MTPGTDDPLNIDLDLAVAELQSNMTDVRILLKVLVGQLADVLQGNRLIVERAGRIRKNGPIMAVEIAMGNDTFRAEVEGPSLRCTIGHSSGGIRIRSEEVGMEQWLKQLLGALQAEAAHSESARQALQDIVIGKTS